MEVNKVVYGDTTLIDLSGDSVTPEALAEGVTAHDATGASIVGSAKVIDVVPVSMGGTGATTAEAARTNLGAAPAGYGLGTSTSKIISSVAGLDEAVENGWYSYECPGTTINGIYFNYGFLLVSNRRTFDAIYQELHITNMKRILWRIRRDSGEWSDWYEYVTTYNIGEQTAKTISDTLPISNGGTGATTAEGARTNLGALEHDKWMAVTQGQTWSRICYIASGGAVIGMSGILSVRCTRADVVSGATFVVCSAHPSKVYITQINGNGYTSFKIRGVTDRNANNTYIEIYDSAAAIAAGTNQTWHCSFIPITDNCTFTKYTSFTSGATVPSGYTANTALETAEGTFVGDLRGNATSISDTLPISKGGTGATTVADALANLGLTDLVASGAKIATGSYSGTGIYGESSKNQLSFSFEPKLVVVAADGSCTPAVFVRGCTTTCFSYNGGIACLYVICDGNWLQWYSITDATRQFNDPDVTYNYVAIG